ncbi:MAG: 23S rRNA (adenine(2503)-C(2))-methyltransferase RlmN [Holosporaceae bacterium]|jgi:23S rRNA (adenine2503-C2)-methyltransferase|nr:23S rRNA (adenine(2503)-C(2))-methyltransferase RlmN [Holosporaceae bacterium]
MQKINLLGFTLDQLKFEFLKNGLSVLDAKRVFPWIHAKLAASFDVMTDVPLETRKILEYTYSLARPRCLTLQKSSDRTCKALLEMSDGNLIETALIPEERRTTVCISTQIGCAMGCKFCHTGTQNFVRNLTSSEIISQIFFWKTEMTITNVVFMGMGEPLLNFKNLSSVLELLLNEKTHNFSRNKITVSTSGIVDDAIESLAKFGVKLAISLHAHTDEKRSFLMPINKKYNIKTLLEAARIYRKNSNTDYVTFEYLLLKDVNDANSDALVLARLLKSAPCKVNLIAFNGWPGAELTGSPEGRQNEFARILASNGIRVTVRKSKGKDILAACGQLKGTSNLL